MWLASLPGSGTFQASIDCEFPRWHIPETGTARPLREGKEAIHPPFTIFQASRALSSLERMAVSVSVGTTQLLQLGVGVADIALLLHAGRKLGNFFRVASNDDELLATLCEDMNAILRRRDLIDTAKVERRWSQMRLIYQANTLETSVKQPLHETKGRLSPFSWAMIMIVTTLDVCLPSHAVIEVVTHVFGHVLDRSEELEATLRVLLPSNIQSWRSAGCARGMTLDASKAMRDCRARVTGHTALPQLNEAETHEMQGFLVWLLGARSSDRPLLSAMVYGAACALEKLGMQLRTGGERVYEAEPMVSYAESAEARFRPKNESLWRKRRGRRNMALQIAFPRGNPMAMIHAVAPPGQRNRVNNMIRAWGLGTAAAEGVFLKAEADESYTKETDVYYVLEDRSEGLSVFSAEVNMLAGRAFPIRSEAVLFAVDQFSERLGAELMSWLQQHTEVEFLKKTEDRSLGALPKQTDVWLMYQSLVFGFYYKLVEPLLSFQFTREDAHFKGLWGQDSTTFLGMCIQFGDTLRREGRVSRPHLLHLLSTMYTGRPKWFSPLSASHGLVGVLGLASIVSKSLLHPSDDPNEIGHFVLADLPILDLAADTDGELFASAGGGIAFDQHPPAGYPTNAQRSHDQSPWKMGLVRAESPREKWSLMLRWPCYSATITTAWSWLLDVPARWLDGLTLWQPTSLF